MNRLGLRTRILLALLITSALTLAVAALALLSPLQARLEDQSRSSLRTAILSSRGQLESTIARSRGNVDFDVVNAIQVTASRTGARLVLYDAQPYVVQQYDTETTPIREDDVYRAFIERRTIDSSSEDASRLAVMLRPAKQGLWILAVRKPDTETRAVVSTVRDAFLTAALAGLAVALALGVFISTGLSSRLGRLRRAALRMAAEGPNAPPPPNDDGADEVGDLARALTSMQEALRRQEEARRRFVATASHELRTPLTSLQGNLELLAEDLHDGTVDLAMAREQLDSSQGQLRRLSNLASELLDLSRLDAGVQLRREPVELGELCRAVAAEFELRAHERAVDVEVVPPPGPVWASGDPGAIARVVRILLDNALRFSPAGEAVRVAAAYHGEAATLEVDDRGPGVPEDERDLVFERFQRGSRTGGEGGFGLGLAIGRELAHKLGGELALAPPEPGGGARFALRLPIELPRGRDDAPEPVPPAAPAA